MELVHIIAKWVVIVEFSLIIIIFLTTFYLRATIYYKIKNEQKLTRSITRFLVKLIPLYKEFNEKNFFSSWRRLDILLPIIRTLDKEVDNDKWANIRIVYLQSIILPLAKTGAVSNDWELRCLAAESFALYSTESEESYIIKLVTDEVALIRYSALAAAILLGSEAAINLIIMQMIEETWMTQSIYLSKFDKASVSTRIYVENCLKNSSNLKIRAACYHILVKYPPHKAGWDLNPDIYSKSMNVKIAALKFISYTDRDAAIPKLLDMLEDTQWQVRTVAIHCLSNLKVDEAMTQISFSLKDTNKWVGLAAAEALYDFGEKGVQILESQNIVFNRAAYNVANHVLNVENLQDSYAD